MINVVMRKTTTMTTTTTMMLMMMTTTTTTKMFPSLRDRCLCRLLSKEDLFHKKLLEFVEENSDSLL